MAIYFVINIDKNTIHIHNDKDIELFNKDLIDIFLKACQHICQSKKHYLVFKMAKPSFKNYLLFIFFANSHLMICTDKVKRDEISSLT